MVAMAFSIGSYRPCTTSSSRSAARLNLCMRVQPPDLTSASMIRCMSSSVSTTGAPSPPSFFLWVNGATKSDTPSFHHLDPSPLRKANESAERFVSDGTWISILCRGTILPPISMWHSSSVQPSNGVSAALPPGTSSVTCVRRASSGCFQSLPLPLRTPQCMTTSDAVSVVNTTRYGSSSPSFHTDTRSSAFDPREYTLCQMQSSSSRAAFQSGSSGFGVF
mmetsp:Transcript_7846/g.21387  ORF Transcript_7846/g.21387 Transcript_7846/m.21387 type:complete len:221 (+) Transcript_7846:2593-3255(+)